ncbi:ATP-binding protein [Taibaiella helva]|uniref:ATP-binding protein n=1 Tax=Taibaiella helva TaxID=2301235 RepID=UPI001E56355C|nr:tetratricopeptide repeat protein [Taibaiella helva]
MFFNRFRYRLLFGAALLTGSLLLPAGRGRAQEQLHLSHATFSRTDTLEVRALIRKGIVLLSRNTDSAIACFEAAETLSRNTGFDDGIGYALAFLGAAVTDKGDFSKGLALYREAMPYCRRARFIGNALPSLYINMGGSFFQVGNYERAYEYYYQALKYLQQYMPSNDNIAAVYNNLATVQEELGQHRQALDYALKAEAFARKKNAAVLVGSALVNKGTAYDKLLLSDSAMLAFREALQLSRKEGVVDIQQACLTSIGDLLLKAGRNREAVAHYREAMQLSTTTSPIHAFITPGYSLGLALFRLGEYREAEQILLAALARAEETRLTGNMKDGRATLAALYEATGRYREALEQHRLYDQLKDSQTNTEKVRAINEVEARYQTIQKDKALLEKEWTIAEQKRKLEHKNMLIGTVVGGTLILLAVVIGVWRSRRRIAMRDRRIEQLKAMMTGEEKERVRLSRELHDGIGGMLTGIKMNLKTWQKLHEHEVTGNGLGDVMEMLQDMGREIHKTAHNLMPDILLKHHLREALQLYCEQLDTGGRPAIDLQLYGDLDSLDKSLELPVYRMIQELLQNILKHAQATLVAIQVRREGNVLSILVEDNGSGFRPQDKKGGLGLMNIEARVQALNGYFSIEPAAKGTTAFIELDLDKIN